MPEMNEIRYSPWKHIMEERYESCFLCKKKKATGFGELWRRYVTERDGDMHIEYKIVCPICGQSTDVHRSKLLTTSEWGWKQDPEGAYSRE